MEDNMPRQQQSFFRQPEPVRVVIAGNEVLQKACNRLLEMIDRDPSLLDGNSMAEVDRKLYAETLWEDGIHRLLSIDKKPAFIDIVIKTQDSEVTSRARRWLLEHDYIRLSSQVVKKAEQFRARISGAMH